MDTRPLCQHCRLKPAAVNYIRNGSTHYRSKCGTCITAFAHPNKIQVPAWRRSGYKKKNKCEQCGFKAFDHRQITVFYIDGNLKNNNWHNLKSICANCTIEISINGLDWKPDSIKPDY